jgi:ASC-1-like (ASCH) protein
MNTQLKSCTLMEKYIRLMEQGRKTIEARVAIPMFESWNIGDKIRFFSRRNPGIAVIVQITAKNRYKSFRQMLESEGTANLIPGITSVDEGERIYLEIPNYAEREKQYGVLAFRFRLIQSPLHTVGSQHI